MSHPEPINDDSIIPVHDLQEQQRLEVGWPEVVDAIPYADDHQQRDQHHQKKWDHKAHSFSVDSFPTDQAKLEYPFLHRFWIEKQRIQCIIPHCKLNHQGEQCTEQNQL